MPAPTRLEQRIMLASLARQMERWGDAATLYVLAAEYAFQDDPELVFGLLEAAAEMYRYRQAIEH